MELIPAKTIVTRTKSTAWFGTEYNMNIYRGCCHGCIYCDSRSECYHVDDFDRVRAKKDALQIIRDDLRRKVKSGVIGTGAMSDPYNLFEKEMQLTRHALELVSAYQFGIGIATKSDLIVRDADILKEISLHSPVICKVTITTADDTLCRKIEPGAPVASRRFAAIKELSKAGIFCGILLMPVLPFLEDTPENITQIVTLAKESGARFIHPMFGVTLRLNQRDWFLDALDRVFPGEGLRGRYEARFGTRYSCISPRVRALWEIFKTQCDDAGILYEMKDIVRAYKNGYETTQLRLDTF